jgi:hypothetical protein
VLDSRKYNFILSYYYMFFEHRRFTSRRPHHGSSPRVIAPHPLCDTPLYVGQCTATRVTLYVRCTRRGVLPCAGVGSKIRANSPPLFDATPKQELNAPKTRNSVAETLVSST